MTEVMIMQLKILYFMFCCVFSVFVNINFALADNSNKKFVLIIDDSDTLAHRELIKNWRSITQQAQFSGDLGKGEVFLTEKTNVEQQAAQINEAVSQAYDAIIINPVAKEGLNQEIKKACNNGIAVISIEKIVSEPCAFHIYSYNQTDDFNKTVNPNLASLAFWTAARLADKKELQGSITITNVKTDSDGLQNIPLTYFQPYTSQLPKQKSDDNFGFSQKGVECFIMQIFTKIDRGDVARRCGPRR